MRESLGGVNGTVFAYGPTGSGKTFTMMGQKLAQASAEEPSQGKRSLARLERLLQGEEPVAAGEGLIAMAVRDLFRQAGQDATRSFAVWCSYLEIYNDCTFDLLRPLERLAEELPVAELHVGPGHAERVLHQGRDRGARARPARRARVSPQG